MRPSMHAGKGVLVTGIGRARHPSRCMHWAVQQRPLESASHEFVRSHAHAHGHIAFAAVSLRRDGGPRGHTP